MRSGGVRVCEGGGRALVGFVCLAGWVGLGGTGGGRFGCVRGGFGLAASVRAFCEGGEALLGFF